MTLNETENLNDYLRLLEKNKDRYLICAAVKDTLYGISKKSIDSLKEIGMSNILSGWNSYIFLMENGEIRIDKNADVNIPMIEHSISKKYDIQMISKAWRAGNRANIIFNGIDLSVNRRGLNIVVVDTENLEVVDSVCFDFFPKAEKSFIRKKDFRGIRIPDLKKRDNDECYDINKKFNEIIKKYQLDEFYPRYSSAVISKEIIQGLSTKWKEGDSVACIVAGSSVLKMYLDESFFSAVLATYKRNQIDFIRCKKRQDYMNSPKEFYNWEAYDYREMEHIRWEGYSHVYIISNQGENFIGKWLRDHNIKYISLYDIFNANGIVTFSSEEYYEFIPDRRESRFFKDNSATSPAQWEYYEQSTKYHTYESPSLQNLSAKKCFFLSLVLKDFLHAEEWKDRISETDDAYKRYGEAWKSIQLLLEEIRTRLKERQQRDILAVWVDHTKYEDLNMMPFISSLADRSIWFENIITLTGYTRETMRGLFTGRKLIDDKTGDINEINLLNSPVLRSLSKYGYDVKILLKGFREMFPQRYQTEDAIYNFVQTPEILWDGISYLLKSETSNFVLLPIEETHPPHISLSTDDENVTSPNKRLMSTYGEADKQIKFYLEMLGTQATAVIFSDHGGCGQGAAFWPRQHVFMSVYGKNYQPRRVKGLCSSLDFYKIMNWIIQGEEIHEEELFRDYCELQGVPIVSSRMKVAEEGILPQAAPAFFPIFRGYRGIVTNDHVYLHFADGHEWLSRRDKLQPRLSWYARPDDICDVKLLAEMRSKAGIDYGNEPADYGARSEYYLSLQKTYEENYAYNENKLLLLNDLFAKLPTSSAALYLGSLDAQELYLALSLENRKKISCIIDDNANCACSELGVEIISLENAVKRGVHSILFTSRTLPAELGDYLNNKGKGIHAFGIYGWFDVNGYHTKHNFYDFAIQSMDASLPSPTAIPDFLHYISPGSFTEIAVIVIVEDEKTLLPRLHDILKQAPLGISIHCLDLTGKAAETVKDYQKIDSSIEVIQVDGYNSLPSQLNELLSSVNSKYIFFLGGNEYLHVSGLSYLHEMAEKAKADVVSASAAVQADKDSFPGMADFSSGDYELQKDARALSATYHERCRELTETEIPSFVGTRLYRVDFLRKYGIRFMDIKYGWKDIFCLQTIFGSPSYVKAASPVCIISPEVGRKEHQEGSAEEAKEMVESMFSYQRTVDALLTQWGGFGHNPAISDEFREKAMDIFDRQYFSGTALDDAARRIIRETMQQELQKNPSIGMWWIKYLFMRSSFPQSV